MIEHISLRCRNSRSSRKFLREGARAARLPGPTGSTGDSYGFIQGGRHDFWVTKGKVGTPIHLAFHADATSAVEPLLTARRSRREARTTDHRMREEYGYAAFVLDPDGHNVEAVVWNEDLERSRSRGSDHTETEARQEIAG